MIEKTRKMVRKIPSIWILMAVVSFCCFGFVIVKIETPNSYMKKVIDSSSGYIQVHEFGEVKLKVRYQSPEELCIKQTMGRDSEFLDVSQLKKEFDQSMDFELEILLPSATNDLTKVAGSTMAYQELVNYLAFGIQEDLTLSIDEAIIKCDFVHFERNYGISPKVVLQFGFHKKETIQRGLNSGSDIRIRFDANRFNLGPIYFHFENDLITDKPFILY